MKDIILNNTDSELREITGAVLEGRRLTPDEALTLYNRADLSLMALLATTVKRRKSGDAVFFNRNFHIEPTNICIYNCRFCSYHKPEGDPDSWELSEKEILDIVRRFDGVPVTEVHITGGVHPSRDIHYYGRILSAIRNLRPDISIKAFSAVELDYMIRKAGMSYTEGLTVLRDYGLDSIPGGGAEIFDPVLRRRICREKADAETYLAIHEAAHMLGLSSNATMLYGHAETPAQRIDHMIRLRELQDRTGGFNAFIPLKFRRENNRMHELGEVPVTEDMRNYALSRILLDNFSHVKAYWPATGKNAALMSLAFGADDLDGTIDDTTRIYSMAGSEESRPTLSTTELVAMIRSAGFRPVERDTNYRTVKEW
ncbi:MAG: CofH family radical SAM protein [Bacteroidales bacterium]|nr:CofH family radical SAM protein [Bacteroidales bacterium]MCB9028230.1 CofH family radical SAM protein [Bacteroidales bacterium]MDD3736229.1 CofH family radical SAM protein [Bacteroidales bacterium]HOO65790.1 CofH family radical SAM protein [Bacteroidales bacterium]HPE21981.1 CofH family radical SAM protein [Bacteroidales bacterium]